MEDIIEEIFGEIADEYDVQEDIPYKKVGNSWIVDGRMNISDAEEYFNLKIHHENSYDTLGGHVFHKVGAVPQKGMKIHHENFDIEIITCSERSVGKLKITPRKKKLSPS
ncbi:hemolysin [Chlamydia abortus]|nr:hemolysin [Chlamydia abortus]